MKSRLTILLVILFLLGLLSMLSGLLDGSGKSGRVDQSESRRNFKP